MARPRDQAARRAQLVEAASQAVLDRGSSGARLRDIAEHAGLTSASVLYYFPDIGELMAAVFEEGTRTYVQVRRAAVEACTDPWDRLAACIRSGVPFPGEPATTSRLLYELLPLTFRNESAAEQQRRFFAEQAALYEEVLRGGEEVGAFRLLAPAPFLARSFVALEDGYDIEVVAGTTPAAEVEERLLHHARLMTRVEEQSPR
jgi:AcrR family transcriptional regulator